MWSKSNRRVSVFRFQLLGNNMPHNDILRADSHGRNTISNDSWLHSLPINKFKCIFLKTSHFYFHEKKKMNFTYLKNAFSRQPWSYCLDSTGIMSIIILGSSQSPPIKYYSCFWITSKAMNLDLFLRKKIK